MNIFTVIYEMKLIVVQINLRIKLELIVKYLNRIPV